MINTAFTHQEYIDFCQYLESACGIVLGTNKQYLVRSRLTPLITSLDVGSVSEVIQIVLSRKNPALLTAVIDAMTTNETLWFRDTYPFQLLAEHILPQLFREKSNIKIWSAASSSGQEPYSIAMTIDETLKKNPLVKCHISITATDISSCMLAHCKAGIYDAHAIGRGLSEERKQVYFDELEDGRVQVKSYLKQAISFRYLNLLDNYHAIGRFDVIYCRNVLIYFSAELKRKVLEQIAAALLPGGYLILGASESLTGFSERFEMVRCNPGIIYRLKTN